MSCFWMTLRRRAVGKLSVALLLATTLAGCDKCGDYFWIDGATPHSCKQGPAAQ